MSGKNHKLYVKLDSHFIEIKELILLNSTPIVAEILSKKYMLQVSRRDLDNYLFNYRSDFDVASYRKSAQIFDFRKAMKEDANEQFHRAFP